MATCYIQRYIIIQQIHLLLMVSSLRVKAEETLYALVTLFLCDSLMYDNWKLILTNLE